MVTQKYISLIALADRFGLPLAWVKAEALVGRLPCLRVGRRLMFNIEAVEQALRERAKDQQVKPAAVTGDGRLANDQPG